MAVHRRWLSVADAAEYLSVAPRTLVRLLDQGAIPRHRLGTRSVRIDLRELDRYMEDQVEQPWSPPRGHR